MNKTPELYRIEEPPSSSTLHLPPRPVAGAQPRSVRSWPRNQTLAQLLRIPPKQ